VAECMLRPDVVRFFVLMFASYAWIQLDVPTARYPPTGFFILHSWGAVETSFRWLVLSVLFARLRS
jgi:hypothetical protein